MTNQTNSTVQCLIFNFFIVFFAATSLRGQASRRVFIWQFVWGIGYIGTNNRKNHIQDTDSLGEHNNPCGARCGTVGCCTWGM